jgi:hypothetical protein
LISYEKNLTTIFIQLLRTKTIKNKIKNKYSENKNMKKEEKRKILLMWLQVKLRRENKNLINVMIASEVKKRRRTNS